MTPITVTCFRAEDNDDMMCSVFLGERVDKLTSISDVLTDHQQSRFISRSVRKSREHLTSWHHHQPGWQSRHCTSTYCTLYIRAWENF